MIKALFFDLDDTLYDATAQTFSAGKQHVIRAMIDEGFPLDEETSLERMDSLIDELGPDYESVIRRMCEEQDIEQYRPFWKVAKHAYETAPLPKLEPFPDTAEILSELSEHFQLFLISTGNREQQLKKIVDLGLDESFDEVCIDEDSGKKACFEELMEKHGLDSTECVAIGNRLDSEIKDAKELGMPAIYLKHGKYTVLDPLKGREPDVTISSLAEVPRALRQVQEQDL